MALSAAATAALKKLGTAAATDKNVAKIVGGIALGVVLVLVTPILALFGVFSGGSELDLSVLAAQAQNEQLAYFEQVMLAIEDEISAQGWQIDPIQAQMIYLCALQGREREDNFYTNYIACFADGQDVFLVISETFGVAFTEDDIEKIAQLVGLVQESQTGPPNNVHARVLELTADDETPLPEGVFLSPLHGQDWKPLITSGFGMRIHPVTGKRSFHTGIDLGVGTGTALYPAQAGKVLITGNDPDGYGLYVVVHYGGGMATLYAHCSKILVSEGQAVTNETVIARSGDTGISTGPHLHLEFVDNGVPINPKNYLQRGKTANAES